jgi:hypothetical protein
MLEHVPLPWRGRGVGLPERSWLAVGYDDLYSRRYSDGECECGDDGCDDDDADDDIDDDAVWVPMRRRGLMHR